MPASELYYRVYAGSDSESVGASATVTYTSPKLAPPAHRIWYVRHLFFSIWPSTMADFSVGQFQYVLNKVITSLQSSTGVSLSQSVNPLSIPASLTQNANIGSAGGWIVELEFSRPIEIDSDLGESLQASLSVSNSNTTTATSYWTFFSAEVIETSKKSVLEG